MKTLLALAAFAVVFTKAVEEFFELALERAASQIERESIEGMRDL